jgi:hypothetical protein
MVEMDLVSRIGNGNSTGEQRGFLGEVDLGLQRLAGLALAVVPAAAHPLPAAVDRR